MTPAVRADAASPPVSSRCHSTGNCRRERPRRNRRRSVVVVRRRRRQGLEALSRKLARVASSVISGLQRATTTVDSFRKKLKAGDSSAMFAIQRGGGRLVPARHPAVNSEEEPPRTSMSSVATRENDKDARDQFPGTIKSDEARGLGAALPPAPRKNQRQALTSLYDPGVSTALRADSAIRGG